MYGAATAVSIIVVVDSVIVIFMSITHAHTFSFAIIGPGIGTEKYLSEWPHAW